MYRYNEMDQRFVRERVEEFRGQVQRRLAGQLTEDEFRPLRLMNGLYLQRHAYMLRVCIPYGALNSRQVRKLGYIAERYDRGFGHITTRQNIQYNWVKLEEVPDLLDHLAEVEMHAIQTSGNCVRNFTCDPMAGVAPDEVVDVRPHCEILRQYFALHPEFMYLPRKFKVAVSGSAADRAATLVHDIGLKAKKNDAGEVGFEVYVGGGLGRTPKIALLVRDFLHERDIVSYCEAILRVYNLYGRRDNKYKARIKITVREMGLEKFTEEVEREWQALKDEGRLAEDRIEEVAKFFRVVQYDEDAAEFTGHEDKRKQDPAFDRWLTHNVKPHKVPGYHVVYLSLKWPGRPPGDLVTKQFYAVADLMDAYSQGYCNTTYEQNLVLPYVKSEDLEAVWEGLKAAQLATPNIDTLNDMICCPGLDFCALANATSIPIAKAINERFDDLDELYELGDIRIKMSGCINACGHHHTGHIGILGIDKRGEEFYQLVLGGSAGGPGEPEAAIGKIIGRAVAKDEVVEAIEKLLDCYVDKREGTETFAHTVQRLGLEPFQEYVYG